MNHYEVKNVRGHYEVYINGEFYCSCDTLSEVDEALATYEIEQEEKEEAV